MMIYGVQTTTQKVDEEENEIDEATSDDPFAKFIDGIAGVLFIGVKIIPAMLGKLLNIVMDGLSNEKITIYNILFNKVELTNINFFEESSGQNATTINAIRQNVAIWYYSLRNIAAVILAIILVYIGIRMAMSTVAEDKAKYKTMFVDWVTSLCLLFVLQFIMIATININESFVTTLSGAGSSVDLESVENQLFKGVFELGFIEGLGNAIAYMMLVGMSFIYLFSYVKRMITIAFLIIISPLITVTYSIDKMGDGRSQALNTWLKEFIYNILIQPFQCIIYLSLVTVVFNLLTSNVNLINVFIAVYVLIFMFQAEEIVKKIFGFRADSMGKTIAAAAVTSALISKGTDLFKGSTNSKNKASSGPSTYTSRPTLNNNGTPVDNSNGGSYGSQGGSGGQAGSNTGGTNGSQGGSGGQAGSNNGGSYGSQGGSGSQAGSNTGGANGNTGRTQFDTTTTQDTPTNTNTGNRSNGRVGRVLKTVGSGLLRANIAGGLRVAGTALGLSTGDIKGGLTGYTLGSSASNAINRGIKTSRQKNYDEERRAQVARDIDDYQNLYKYTNTQVKQNIEDWLDGIKLPNQNDDEGLKLYQHLMDEKEALKDIGMSSDDIKANIEQLIADSFTGKQSRISSPSIYQRVKNYGNRFTGKIHEVADRHNKNA